MEQEVTMLDFAIGFVIIMAAVGTADHNAEMPLVWIAMGLLIGCSFIGRAIINWNQGL